VLPCRLRRSSRLLAKAIRRLTLDAFDPSSTLGAIDTAEVGAHDAAMKARTPPDSLHS